MQARLTPELAVGGGWASALLVGSDFPHWQTHVAPGVAFDLSTGPVVKILSSYRLTWSRYGPDASSLLHDGALNLRLRLSRQVDLDLRASVEQVDFEDISGSASGDPSAPPTAASLAFDAGPVLRWRLSDRTTAEASLAAGKRANDLGDGASVEEDFQVGVLSLIHRFSGIFEAGVQYRRVRNRTTDALWDMDGDGGQVSLGIAPWGELVVRGYAGLQWSRFAADERSDRYGYTGLGASLPVAPSTTAEIAWSYGANTVVDGGTEADRSTFEGTRQVVWSGLRMELPWWL